MLTMEKIGANTNFTSLPQAPKGDVKTQYLKVLVVKIGDDPPQAPEGDVKTQYLKVLVEKLEPIVISTSLPQAPKGDVKTQYLMLTKIKIGTNTNLTSPIFVPNDIKYRIKR